MQEQLNKFQGPDGIIEAIQWDVSQHTFRILQESGMRWEPGPMGGKTFFLGRSFDRQQIEVREGDWIVKDGDQFSLCGNQEFEKNYHPIK